MEVADCHALPYPDDSFDTVLMVNLLHVIPDRAGALRQVVRVLKPGGRLLLVSITLHGMSILETVRMMVRYTTTYGRKSGSNIKLSPELAEQMLTQAGFGHVRTRLLGDKVKAVVGDAVWPVQDR